jgi:hypothetical protein
MWYVVCRRWDGVVMLSGREIGYATQATAIQQADGMNISCRDTEDVHGLFHGMPIRYTVAHRDELPLFGLTAPPLR